MTMENYLSKLTEPYVGEVKVPDFNQIRQNALATAAAEGQFQDQEYKRYSRNYLNGLLANNPNASGDEIGNALAQGGVGAEAIPYQYNWLNQQASKLKFESDLRKEVASVIGTVKDDATKNQAIDYLESRFPNMMDFSQYRAMPWQQAVQSANAYRMGPEAATRVQLAQNADQRAANQDAREASEESRKAALFPGKAQEQDLTNRGKALDNQGKRDVLDAGEEVYVYADGTHGLSSEMRKSYDKFKAANPYGESNMSYEEYIRNHGVQGVAKRNPKSKDVDMNTMRPIGQGQNQQGQGQQGQGQSGQTSFGPAELKAAVTSGKVSRADAEAYARNMGWIR